MNIATDVELSVTCWERTYRDVLKPGFFPMVEAMNATRFARRVAVLNNIENMDEAVWRAERLVDSGELSTYHIVAETLLNALKRTGLRRRHLMPLQHYTDHFLVAVTRPGCKYLLCWDSDARLVDACDWVGPSLKLLADDPSVLIAQPGWKDGWSMAAEQFAVRGEFDLGFGFTDHIFLVERARLARPVYRLVAPASWWYPTSHLTPIFEQRVDAFMRRTRLRRAVYRPATYFHEGTMASHPAAGSSRIGRKARRASRAILEKYWPGFNPTFVRRPHLRGH